MQFLALISWWYGLGWLDQVRLTRERFARAADRYSVGLLIRTLFLPFKQLDAYGSGGASLNARLRTWLDRQISRAIGAMMRIFMLVVGLLVIIGEGIIALLRLVSWPLLPLLPLVGFVLMISGWMPWL